MLAWFAVLSLTSVLLSAGYILSASRVEVVETLAKDDLGLFPDAAAYQSCRSPGRGVELPTLVGLRQWRTTAAPQPDSVTLVTQLSMERLPMLRAQCRSWRDRIAAAVYVPFVAGHGSVSAEAPSLNGTSEGEVLSLLAALHRDAEAAAAAGRGCELDLEVVAERFAGWDDPAVGLYPINAVRNRALGLAGTDAVLLLDVDFLPSASTAALYRGRPGAYAQLLSQLTRGSVALVLPAFEPRDKGEAGREAAEAASRAGKAATVRSLLAGDLLPFQVAQYAKGHTPTNYTRWPAATQQYAIQYEMGYEPYIVVARCYVPYYDERFRGYGRDKLVHLAHIAALGLRFVVHPEAFVVHQPHDKAATFRATKASGQWDHLAAMYKQVQKELADSVGYVPVTSFAKQCAKHWREAEYAAQHREAAAREAQQRRRQRAMEEADAEAATGGKRAVKARRALARKAAARFPP